MVRCLAQGHRATLRSSDGAEGEREVAVKVQHLKVKQHSMVDIYTMDFLAKVRRAILTPGKASTWRKTIH